MTSKRILTQLEGLRRSLADADGDDDGSFARVFGAFLDIAEDPALMTDSQPAKEPDILVALERVAQRLTGDARATVQNMRALRVAEVGMLHGGFFVGSLLGTFFYFEREMQGLVAFNDGSPMTNFMRLTMTPVPAGTYPVPGPKGQQ